MSRLPTRVFFELLDGGISRSRQLAIESYMQSLPGVVGVHCLRTRKQAGDICLDAHIITSPFISVSEGHFIGEQLCQSVMCVDSKILSMWSFI